jgi:hypothetical protein
MEARNRTIPNWYGMIERGEIKLPRFQRHEAWDRQRIRSLFDTVINELPLGITLVLEVGDAEKFVSRYLATAPEAGGRVHEQLLDGQQRLTALWRVFQDNYASESYFVYFREFDRYGEPDEDEPGLSAKFEPRYVRSNGNRYPLWADVPSDCLYRGLVPSRLFRPGDVGHEIKHWIEAATEHEKPGTDFAALETFLEFRQQVSDRINAVRAAVSRYNLPHLSLPSSTDKATALDVFINMNTNTKPLSAYDIIVAEVESATGVSLHDMQAALDAAHPEIARYRDLSELLLGTAALLQARKPDERGVQNIDAQRLVDDWQDICRGLSRMAIFLRGQGVFDAQRLPTKSVLPVLAALYAAVPANGDARGQAEQLLQRYLWRAFFTNRYELSANSSASADFQALRKVIGGVVKDDGTPWSVDDVPIFRDYALMDAEQLLAAGWPRRMSIAGRGVLAVTCRLGARDFSTGEQVSPDTIGERQYHHVFPDSLLQEARIDGYLALNCALIEGPTNLHIGRKDPLAYLADRYQWADEATVAERLSSHLIPADALANGGYEGLDEAKKAEKLAADFEHFLVQRAELVMKAVQLLEEGRHVSAPLVLSEV